MNKVQELSWMEGIRAAFAAADGERKLAPIGMKQIEIGYQVLEKMPGIVEDLVPGRLVIVADSNPMFRRGIELKSYVRKLLHNRMSFDYVSIGRDGELLHADEETGLKVSDALAKADGVLVIGSGTIVDICKDAVMRRPEPIPIVVVQTAASVNAFSDNMAVLLKDGVKRTVPSRWPDVLLIDLDVIAGAPAVMNAAGFGDLMSMWTAPVDWYLAHLLGMNDTYHHAPGDLVRKQGEVLLEKASLLSDNDPETLDLLARVLTLSGIAMGVARSSEVVSGTEHLISHLIDMSAEMRGNTLALHGAQVGLSTVIAASAWELFIERFDPGSLDIDTCYPAPSAMKDIVQNAFSRIDDTGRMGAECWRDYEKKLARWTRNRPRFETFLHQWQANEAQLKKMLKPPQRICDALKKVGAPVRFRDLDPSVDRETVIWALRNSHLMRNRFSLIDLVFYTGYWNDEFVDRVLQRARSAGLDF